MQKIWWLGVTQGHGQCHHSIERALFLFNFNRNYAAVSFSRCSELFVKIADFNGRGDPGGISGRLGANESRKRRVSHVLVR